MTAHNSNRFQKIATEKEKNINNYNNRFILTSTLTSISKYFVR